MNEIYKHELQLGHILIDDISENLDSSVLQPLHYVTLSKNKYT